MAKKSNDSAEPVMFASAQLDLSLPAGRRAVSLGASVAIQLGVLALLVLILGAPAVRQPLVHLQQEVLYVPQLTPPPPVAPPHVRPHPQPQPRPQPPRVEVAAVRMPALPVPPPPPQPVERRVIAPVAAPAPHLSAPAAMPELVDRSTPTIHAPVVLNNLPTEHAATLPQETAKVQTGGFGKPDGLPAPNPAASGNVAQMGSFDMPAGPGYGNGRDGAQGARGVVEGGFGNGGGGAGGNGAGNGNGTGGNGTARMGGFSDNTRSPLPGASPAAPTEVSQTPVEILFKPDPQYTDEARAQHIQGDVVVRVRFQANGSLAVLQVVSGLGHGLDQQALAAARQIRFKPATRGGMAIDSEANLRITFQIAN